MVISKTLTAEVITRKKRIAKQNVVYSQPVWLRAGENNQPPIKDGLPN